MKTQKTMSNALSQLFIAIIAAITVIIFILTFKEYMIEWQFACIGSFASIAVMFIKTKIANTSCNNYSVKGVNF